MIFKVGDRVQKKTGYRFVGTVVSAYQVLGGNRYDVQVDARQWIVDIGEMADAYSFPDEVRDKLMLYASNCNSMIHIFAEEQLEPSTL